MSRLQITNTTQLTLENDTQFRAFEDGKPFRIIATEEVMTSEHKHAVIEVARQKYEAGDFEIGGGIIVRLSDFVDRPNSRRTSPRFGRG